ncbi:radical SAM additional 4Fe4S-binding domain protein [Marinitoga piezophila KA3]|uniref:Radical SAM additional 4Fe4S-binding domain protein n=1 Tax=Marinitoga piezophila (strain DSM 14283 / JCM 11233 / KA3) TaxID=443254 RepID=H2J532_MARPK|nr:MULTISPECIES: radical SAM protein [Marinitoga]AEX86049.1 radical SAM additional 4Fe4S-binding domain protein [Marinitoga piezophila KA3]APT76469.1 hypothetical protein LN42_08850 [Marinitoga sp. 1137]
MKPSKYNFIFEYEKNILIYNALSGGFAIIEPEVKKALSSEKDLEEFINKEKNKKIYKELKKGKFIVDFDELKYINFIYNSLKFEKKGLGLTIAPTMNCNFACEYCYELRKKVFMDKEVKNSIVDFVKQNINEINYLSVSWYGGEPLLDLKTIKELSKEFIKLCQSNNIKYTASIVTNGYLLNSKVAKELKNLEIKTVQITIDGPKKIHDKRRPLINGKGSFETIINNIKGAKEYFEHISIRINIDKTNEGKIIELLKYLKNEGLTEENCSPYLAFVDVSTEVCRDIEINCIDIKNRSEYMIERVKEAYEEGINIIKYPTPMYSQCGAVKPNSFVIDPEGYMYKCWHEVGIKALAIGNIKGNEKNKNFDRYLKWNTFNPLNYKECKNCKFLPLCMGGCPDKTLFKYNGIQEEGCTMYKYNLEEMLKMHLKAKLKKGFLPIPVK